MEVNWKDPVELAPLVAAFMYEMHRYDGGRTLPLLHAAQLTMPQLAVLEYVVVARTVSTVAEYAGLSRPATSFMIDKLVRRGFVRRSEGVVDRRERAVALTAKGRALLARVHAARVARFETSLGVLSPRAADRLTGALQEAMAELGEVGQSPTKFDRAQEGRRR
jgi:DNA-binding MarR family transcriptional regulator